MTTSPKNSYNSIIVFSQDFSVKNTVDFFLSEFSFYNSQDDLINALPSKFYDGQGKRACKEGVNPIFMFDGNQQSGKGKKHNQLQKKVMYIFKSANTDCPTDEMRKDFLKIYNSGRLWLKIHNEELGWRVFEGKKRGNRPYCKYYHHKIIDYTQNMIDRGLELMALTVTCDAKGYTVNRLDAWAGYRGATTRLMKEINRIFPCEYISVLESTAKGYPHAHIVLAFRKGTIQGYSKLKNNKPLKYGKLYSLVKKFSPAPQFKLCPIKGKHTAHYLAKYISKGENEDIGKLVNKEGSFTKEERKLIDCLMYCTACQARQVSMSQNKKCGDCSDKAAGQTDASQVKESSTAAIDDHTDRDPPNTETSPPTAAGLIARCINFPNHCKYRARIMTQSRKESLFSDLDGREIEADYEKLKLFDHNSAVVGCGGCIFSEIALALSTLDFKLLNVVYWDKDYKRKRWFDDVDLLDEKALTDRMTELMCFYSRCIVSQKHTTTEFFEIGKRIGLNPYNLPNVTNVSKNHVQLLHSGKDKLYKLDNFERAMSSTANEM